MKRWLVLVMLGLSCGVCGAVVRVAGETFADTVGPEGKAMRLHQAALLRVRLFFDVYVAGLYLADEADARRVLDDVPKRLEIAYLRAIPRQTIVDAAEDHFRRNFKPEQLAPLRERLDAINKLYADVKKGDRYTLTYRPGQGCELALNGQPLGTIPGADFAQVYFSIWLGPGCAAPDLRDTLLSPKPAAPPS